MSEIVTDVVIEAPADRVWAVLTNFGEYSVWNPLIRRVSGNLVLDGRLAVTMAGSDGHDQTAHPTVVHLRPGREFRWLDRLPLPGILDTETTFKTESLGPGQTRFVHWQSTSGLLAPFMGGSHDSRLRDRLAAMNRALKEQVERGPTPEPHRNADAADAPKPVAATGRDLGAPSA